MVTPINDIFNPLQPNDCLLLAHLSLWTWLWIGRRQKQDDTAGFDGFVQLILDILQARSSSMTFSNDSITRYFMLSTHALIIITIYLNKDFWNRSLRSKHNLSTHGAEPSLDFALEPLLIPSKTTHTRLFPKAHSFGYSYLLVGIPVGWKGCSGSMLSAGSGTSRGWFHVSAENHLERTTPGLSLREKLDHFLISQGAEPLDFPAAYLVTAPQFLHYNFNPVSFWYLYGHDKRLKAMILEVNNTFDERRMYLLNKADNGDCKQDQDEIFNQAWNKDFHVSPFNDRQGSYSLVARNIDIAGVKRQPEVDNTITLRSPEGSVKLVARVFSDGPVVQPQSMPLLAGLVFIIQWGWVGFFTFPRIIREASKLYFTRKLDIWFRPEVMTTSIARNPTSTEIFLEDLFYQYLIYLVKNLDGVCDIIYKAAPGTTHSESMRITNAKVSSAERPAIELNIISPAFYSRFVHYSHLMEALDGESLFTDARNQTFETDRPDLISKYLQDQHCHAAEMDSKRSFLDKIRWWTMLSLRCLPPEQSFAEEDRPKQQYERKDGRSSPASHMDIFIIQNHSDTAKYTRCLTKLFLAQRFAFGLEPIIKLLDLSLRLSCTIAAVQLLTSGHQESCQYDHIFWLSTQVVTTVLSLFATNFVHFWSFLKGI